MSAHYFIADAHVGAGFPKAEQRLVAFMEKIQGAADSLFILGDLFEFWFEYQRAIPRHGFRVIARLAELRRSGTRIVYLQGNHDFWLRSFLKRELSVETPGDELATEIDGRRVYLAHGDGLDRGVVPRTFRRLMRSRMNGALYSLIHPDVGIRLAQWVAGRSRELGAKMYLREDMARFAEAKTRDGFEVVMLGHSHVPERREFPAGVYVNVGDWVRNSSYGVMRDGAVALESFSAGKL
ncbi:MAG: UDP-2,3-diacylglucosamine diphosphatase [candidate division WOR-3 bacterium]